MHQHTKATIGSLVMMMALVCCGVSHAASNPFPGDDGTNLKGTFGTQVVTVENCTCSTCPATFPVSGTCTPDPLNPGGGRNLTCMDQAQQCAQLVNYNEPTCTNFSGVFTAVCNTCQKLNANPPYYAMAICNAETQEVTWNTNCNVGCSSCINTGQYPHPFMECSGALGGNGWTYNQGIQPCDAIMYTAFSSPSCSHASTILDQFVVGQYSCNFDEFMSCYPKSPSITGNPGNAVTLTSCNNQWPASVELNLHCVACESVSFPTGVCSPAPPFLAARGILGVTATCGGQTGLCADLVVHNNSGCGQLIGRSTPVCNACIIAGNDTTYTKVTCNQTSQEVTLSSGCNPTCTSCLYPSNVTHAFLQCDAALLPGMSIFNRGLFPCSTVAYHHYTTASCSSMSLYHTSIVAEGICEFDRMSSCVNNLIQIENCTNPNAGVAVIAENQCVEDQFGYYRQYECLNNAGDCGQVVRYADPHCSQFLGANAALCGQCVKFVNPLTGAEVWEQVSCDPTTQQITVLTNCQSGCVQCQMPAHVFPLGQCVPGTFNDYVRNEGVTGCDAVNIVVYNSSTCSPTTVMNNYSVSQDVCMPNEGFIQCTANTLPIPTDVGSELQITQCSDTHCMVGCATTSFTSGGCMENFQGLPGSHVVSCDLMESWCADLSVHTTPNCQTFAGYFHPVCGQCIPSFMNQSDPFGFTQVSCDHVSQNITFSFGCDSRCRVCSQPNARTHGFMQCNPDFVHQGWSIINRGIVPCATTSVVAYSTTNCMGGSMVASWQVARDFCDMGMQVQCAHQSIGVQNCSACNGDSSSNAGCNKTFITEHACSPDPYAVVPGGMRTVSCVPTWERCIHAAFFASPTCTEESYQTSASLVCGKCSRVMQMGKPIFTLAVCDPVFNYATILTMCNADCTQCNATDATIMYDSCTPTTYFGGVYTYGIQLCDVVQLTQYSSATCTGNPYGTYYAGQHQCNFDDYYECSSRPLSEPVPFNGKVTWSTCPNPQDVACMGCVSQQFASGSCTPVANATFGSGPQARKVVCSFGATSTCANMAIHNGSQCSSYLGDHTPVCGSCFQFMGEGTYTQFLCDTVTQTVTVNRGCQPNCVSCTAQDVHPYLSCTLMNTSIANGLSVYNRGLMPCDAATVMEYSTTTCATGTLIGSFQMAQSQCAFDHFMSCEPHLVYIQNCSCPTCPETTLLEGMCAPDPFGKYRRYACANSEQMCATLLQYESSAQCQPAWTPSGGNHNQPMNWSSRPTVFSAVCGSCVRQINPQTGTLQYFWMDCNMDLQSVTWSGGCDSQCKVCSLPNIATHPLMECSPSAQGGGSIFNQGLRPCSAVQVSVYEDQYCTGSPDVYYTSGQRDCGEFDHLYIFCDANPPATPPDGGEILMSMCMWQQGPSAIQRAQEGDCTTGCMTFPITDGGCQPAPPFETRFGSHQTSCDTFSVSTCADLILFNSTTTCTPATFMGVHAAVCGSCYQFGMDITFTQVLCNSKYQTVTFNTGCNSDCSVCQNTNNNQLSMLECVSALQPGLSMVSRGLFSCSTVTMTRYASPNCAPGTSISTQQAAQGICEFNQRFQCATNLITIENCTCPTCPATYAADSQCVADAFGMYRQYTCNNKPSLCANMVFFADATCASYTDGYTLICGSCNRQTDPRTLEVSYQNVQCNVTSQQVTIQVGCTDMQCGFCTGPTFIHNFNNCSEFMGGSSLFNTGLQECDAVSISVYPDSACATTPLDIWTQGEHYCAIDEYISCQAAPSVNVQTAATAIEFYTCPADAYECIGCTVTVQPTGTCAPSPSQPGLYHTTQCDIQPSWCVDFVLHNDTTCTQNFLGAHNPVCGTCSRWFGQSTYTQVQCDVFSQNVTISFNCDAACMTCTESVTHPYLKCSTLITHPSMSLYNRGIMPCATATITENSQSGCPVTGVTAQYQIAQNLCQFEQRIQCLTGPTPAPTPGTGTASSNGMSAGTAVGITLLVVAVVAGAAFAAYRFRAHRAYRTADGGAHWSAMNEAPTPSHAAGSYGAVQ